MKKYTYQSIVLEDFTQQLFVSFDAVKTDVNGGIILHTQTRKHKISYGVHSNYLVVWEKQGLTLIEEYVEPFKVLMILYYVRGNDIEAALEVLSDD